MTRQKTVVVVEGALGMACVSAVLLRRGIEHVMHDDAMGFEERQEALEEHKRQVRGAPEMPTRMQLRKIERKLGIHGTTWIMFKVCMILGYNL